MDPSSANVANQSETPVSSINKGKSPLSSIPLKKLLIPVIIVVFIVIAGIAGMTVLNKSRADSIVSKAKEEILKGNYKKAQENYKQALSIRKNDPKILAGLLDAYSFEGNRSGQEDTTFTDSKKYLDEAVKIDSDDPYLLVSIGYAYETNEDYYKALDYYYKAVKADTQTADAWFHYGHAKEFLGQNEEAQKAYDTAYELDPKNPSILMVRGNRFYSEGKQEEGFQAFKLASEAKDVNPTLIAEALTGAALARGSQDNFRHVNEALELAKKAVDTDPNYSPGNSAYGYYTFITTGNTGKSYDYVIKAIKANPRITKNYILMASIYRAIKDYPNAIYMIDEAIKRVDYDNTILSVEAKKQAKASYIYELAATHSKAQDQFDTLPLLKDAYAQNPAVAQRVKMDYQNGLFIEYSNNAEFLSMFQI